MIAIQLDLSETFDYTSFRNLIITTFSHSASPFGKQCEFEELNMHHGFLVEVSRLKIEDAESQRHKFTDTQEQKDINTQKHNYFPPRRVIALWKQLPWLLV